MFVLPTTIAPAARMRRTTSQSAAAGSPTTPVPCVVSSPATSMLSLTAIGTPSSGAASPASEALLRGVRASSCARSARTTLNALKDGRPGAAMRSRVQLGELGGEERAPERRSSAWRAAPA